jgi:uncharacterized membrane protein YgaE (UPF0421/DUF939 family)
MKEKTRKNLIFIFAILLGALVGTLVAILLDCYFFKEDWSITTTIRYFILSLFNASFVLWFVRTQLHKFLKKK